MVATAAPVMKEYPMEIVYNGGALFERVKKNAATVAAGNRKAHFVLNANEERLKEELAQTIRNIENRRNGKLANHRRDSPTSSTSSPVMPEAISTKQVDSIRVERAHLQLETIQEIQEPTEQPKQVDLETEFPRSEDSFTERFFENVAQTESSGKEDSESVNHNTEAAQYRTSEQVLADGQTLPPSGASLEEIPTSAPVLFKLIQDDRTEQPKVTSGPVRSEEVPGEQRTFVEEVATEQARNVELSTLLPKEEQENTEEFVSEQPKTFLDTVTEQVRSENLPTEFPKELPEDPVTVSARTFLEEAATTEAARNSEQQEQSKEESSTQQPKSIAEEPVTEEAKSEEASTEHSSSLEYSETLHELNVVSEDATRDEPTEEPQISSANSELNTENIFNSILGETSTESLNNEFEARLVTEASLNESTVDVANQQQSFTTERSFVTSVNSVVNLLFNSRNLPQSTESPVAKDTGTATTIAAEVGRRKSNKMLPHFFDHNPLKNTDGDGGRFVQNFHNFFYSNSAIFDDLMKQYSIEGKSFNSIHSNDGHYFLSHLEPGHNRLSNHNDNPINEMFKF